MVRVFDPLVFQTNVFQGVDIAGPQSTQSNTVRKNDHIKTIGRLGNTKTIIRSS